MHIAENIDAPVLEVRHADLSRLSDESIYKSICPVCHEGVLLVSRDPKTFDLLELDACVLCGQRVRYLDVEEMRTRERGETPWQSVTKSWKTYANSRLRIAPK